MLPHRLTVRRAHRFATLGAVAVTTVLGACSAEPKLASISAESHAASWQEWKGKRTAFLSTPGRPMSYTSLTWLHEGPTTVGSDPASGIRLIGRDVPPTIGTLVRTGHEVRFEPAKRAAVTIDSVPATAVVLRTDNTPKPSVVSVGTAGFRIMERVDSLGVRTWDADRVTPDMIAKQIGPLEYFAIDSAWRIPGILSRLAKPDTVAVPTSSGVAEVHIILGVVRTKIAGKEYALTAYAGNSPTDLFFTFSDETSGEETYGFRFLHAAIDTTARLSDSTTRLVALDFNFAYNPDCAFSAFTTCPLPPDENRIGVRIPVGERAVKYLNDSSATERAQRMREKVGTATPTATPAASPGAKKP